MPGRGVGRWFEMVILAPPRSASREGVVALPREGVVALPREGVVALPSVPLRVVFSKKGLMGRQKRLLHTRQSKARKNAVDSEHRSSEAAFTSSYSEPSSMIGLADVLTLASVGRGGTILSSTACPSKGINICLLKVQTTLSFIL